MTTVLTANALHDLVDDLGKVRNAVDAACAAVSSALHYGGPEQISEVDGYTPEDRLLLVIAMEHVERATMHVRDLARVRHRYEVSLDRPTTAEQAEAQGYEVDRHCYPWIAYKGPRFDTDESFPINTPGTGRGAHR